MIYDPTNWAGPTPPYYIYTLDCFILYQSLTEIENVFPSNLIFLIKIHLWLIQQEDQRPQFLQVMYKVSLTFKLNQNLDCFVSQKLTMTTIV